MASAQTSSPWLGSPLWDSFWMLSGLWLLSILLVAHGVGHVPLVPDMLALGAVAFLWGGHIISPVVVSWANRRLRAHMLDNKRKFILLPLALLVVSVALSVLGDLSQWAGVPREVAAHLNPRLSLFYAFMLWNIWHFSGQHYGVLSIYRRTSGQLARRDRRLDRAFCIAMTCVMTPLAWYAQGRKELLAELFSYAPNPSALPALGPAIAITSAVLTLLFVAGERRKPHASTPRALYIFSIGIQPVFGVIAYPIYHLAVFSICHWLIALALASRILRGEVADTVALPRVLRQPAFSMGVLLFMAISAGMFLIFHSRTFHGVLGIVPPFVHGQDTLFAYHTGPFSPAFAALSGAYFGISFIHFAYDRWLYSFSRPEIREWVAPYLFSRAPAHPTGAPGAHV